MPYRTPTEAPVSPIYKGIKLLFLLIGSVWIFVHFAYSFGEGAKVSVSGTHSFLTVPNPYALRLSHSSGQTFEMKSLWRFHVRNTSDEAASDLVFELPFNGFFKVERAGQTELESQRVQSFEGKLPLGSLGGLEEMSVLVWTDKEATLDFERETRLVHKDAIVTVDYPVEVNGFMAWVERNKIVLSFLLVVLFLAYCL